MQGDPSAWGTRISATSSATGEARGATPRKAGAQAELALLFALLAVPGGFWITGRLVGELADRSDRRPRVGAYTHGVLARVAPRLEELRGQAADPGARDRLEALREYVRRELRSDRCVSRRPAGEREARVGEVLALLEKDGPEAVEIESDDLFPGAERWPLREHEPRMVRMLAGLFVVLGALMVSTSLGMGNRDLGRVEWSFLWLATLPVRSRVLFASKLAEFGLFGGLLWLGALPLTILMLVCAGHGPLAVPEAVVAVMAFGAMTGALIVLTETLLRIHLSPSACKNVQALFTVGGLILGGVCWSVVSVVGPSAFLLDWATRLGTPWNPWSLPAQLARHDLPPGAGLALLLAVSAVLTGAAILACEHVTRGGFVTDMAAYRGRRGTREPSRFDFGLIRKDLELLRRDRNFLVQTLVVPVLGLVVQGLLFPQLLSTIAGSFHYAAVAAFGLAAYVLAHTAPRVLDMEGGALWLLYTFPVALERLVVRKTLVWAGLAAAYAGIVLAAGWALRPGDLASAVSDVSMVLAGTVIFAFIGSGLGTLATDPFGDSPSRRARADTGLLFMLLAGFFLSALYGESGHAKVVQLVFSALIALALWRKVRDRLPYLLDPSAAPEPALDASDGLLAALAFFAVQGLLFMLMRSGFGLDPGPAVTLAFTLAGVAVTLATLYSYWRLGLDGLAIIRAPVAEGGGWLPGMLLAGMLSGGALGVAALLYLRLVDTIPALRTLREQVPGAGPEGWWLAALTVLAAPVFEEYIFRGLLFGGLRRTLPSAWAVVASAGLFALVHPPLAVPPVFLLGIVTALLYQRQGRLLGAVAAHALYNLVVVTGG